MSLYCGIDLHSNNHVLTIIDEQDQKIFERRLPNKLETTLRYLSDFQENIAGIAVESTYNWYWLVDGLMEANYKLHLVNTSAVKQYEGIKFTNDEHDAFHLAHLMRLGILPTGYIYPKEQRAIRDLLRKRSFLVRHRTAHTECSKFTFADDRASGELQCYPTRTCRKYLFAKFGRCQPAT